MFQQGSTISDPNGHSLTGLHSKIHIYLVRHELIKQQIQGAGSLWSCFELHFWMGDQICCSKRNTERDFRKHPAHNTKSSQRVKLIQRPKNQQVNYIKEPKSHLAIIHCLLSSYPDPESVTYDTSYLDLGTRCFDLIWLTQRQFDWLYLVFKWAIYSNDLAWLVKEMTWFEWLGICLTPKRHMCSSHLPQWSHLSVAGHDKESMNHRYLMGRSDWHMMPTCEWASYVTSTLPCLCANITRIVPQKNSLRAILKIFWTY